MRIAITAIKPSSECEIEKITRLIFDCACHIEKIRISCESNVFIGFILIDGVWNQIVKLEHCLKSNLADFIISIQRIEDDSKKSKSIPYVVDAIGADHSGTLHNIVQFFGSHNMKILDITSNRIFSPQSSTTLFSAHFIIGLPTNSRIISLRDEFLEYCDELNIDAIFEPVKR